MFSLHFFFYNEIGVIQMINMKQLFTEFITDESIFRGAFNEWKT
jgi:membrane-anchored glycerophosphoryl diester phosphodiesterase (GDPDase)